MFPAAESTALSAGGKAYERTPADWQKHLTIFKSVSHRGIF
jgi:hypothetical protein